MRDDQVLEHIWTVRQHLAALAEAPLQDKEEHREALEDIQALFSNLKNLVSAATPEAKLDKEKQGLEKIQRLWTSSTDYVYTVHIKNGSSVYTTHGPGCQAVTGYSAQEYASDPYLWFHMIHKDDRKLVLEQANRALAGSETIPVEHRILHKDGSLRWIRNAPVPRYDEQGQLIAYDGLITDITKRKKNDAALRESEAKYRALFEASIDAIFLESLEGRIIDCNTAACSLLGYDKQELLKLNVADLVPPEIIRNPPVRLEPSSNQSLSFETFNKRKDGSLVPCEITTRQISVGGIQRHIVFVHDLTERNLSEQARIRHKEAETRAEAAEAAWQNKEKEIKERKQVEAALRESEKRYRTLVDTSPDAIFYISLDLRILFCNQRAAELYGADRPEQLLNMNALDILSLDNYVWIQAGEQADRFPKGWSVRGQELTLSKKNGNSLPAEVSASLVMNQKDEAVGIICMVRDITTRKTLEQYLMRSERLAALGKISAELAHEIKNPLQSVQSNLELVLDFALDPSESQAHLRLCYQELERLVDLTNRLLKQANPNETDPQSINISEVFERTRLLVDKSSRAAGVHIAEIIPAGFPAITVAPDLLTQVLLHLSINAIEAMPQGGQLTLAAEITAGCICLNVINDGKISQTGLQNIFEPFYTTKDNGTGLGLPISYNIIQKMGGSLNATNLQDPERVKFTISFPERLIISDWQASHPSPTQPIPARLADKPGSKP